MKYEVIKLRSVINHFSFFNSYFVKIIAIFIDEPSSKKLKLESLLIAIIDIPKRMKIAPR